MPLKGSGLPLSFAKEPWSAFPFSRLEAAQDNNFEVGLGRLSFPFALLSALIVLPALGTTPGLRPAPVGGGPLASGLSPRPPGSVPVA